MDVVITRQPGVLSSYGISRYQVLKRVMDLLFCILLAPLLAPVMLCCAILIRLDSPGPAIFVQDRIGKDGKLFKIYKFRTMRHNLDNSKHREMMQRYVQGQVGDGEKSGSGKEETAKLYKPFQASEVTRVGRILRKTSLDELPQILNILKGEMSLIGPRPNVPWEVEAYQSWHYERLEVLPGITGLAQVRGRSSISFDRIVQYDIEYVQNQSLTLDLKIIWQTFFAIVLRDGAG
ncbi:MAG: sugar transferase [Anaerolineae bacterium]|nr:sugar transferase [Anaerolineae bacterium]